MAKFNGANREVKQLIAKIQELGVSVVKTNNGHWKVSTPGGVVFLPSTPSDRRTLPNCVSLLRRYGVDIRIAA